MVTRSGVIQSIVVKNFLCHSYLKVDFDKSINFIVGHNGSGKSAILDALILGLGGTASQTRRYDNIKSYVQTNTKFASIEIKIKNDGENAHKYNEYGDYITIIREIKDTGFSSYKVKSASDNLISNKYDDLKSILLAYNIQIDNPISVLPQKATKEFNDLSDELKYRFFLRATNLAQSEENYNKALEECSKAEDTLKIKDKEFDNYTEILRKLEQTKRNLEIKDKYRAEIKQLTAELNCSKILKLEDELKKKDKFKRMKIEQWLRKDKIVKCLNIDDSPLNELRNDLQSKIDVRTRLEDKKNRLDNQLLTFNTKLENTQTSLSAISKIITNEEKKVNGLNKQLQDIMSGSAAQRREELERLVEEARVQLQEASKRLEEAVVNANLADQEYARAQKLLQEAQEHKKQLETKKVELLNEERRLQNNDDPVAKYGECASRLRERVRAAAASFRRPPRGPVGVYLSVKDKIWSGALEQILGNDIRSYCVDSSEDAKKLNDIIDEVYADSQEEWPSVSCCPFLEDKHEVRVPQPRTGVACSALHALDVDDVVIYNFLVDQLELDTILLVETDDQAMQFCRSKENVPLYCKKVVTSECSEYYPAPEYRCYGGAARKARYLQAGAGAALHELREQRDANHAASAAVDRRLTDRTAAYSVSVHNLLYNLYQDTQARLSTAHAQLDQARAYESELRVLKESHESELMQMEVPQLNNLENERKISEQFINGQRQKKFENEEQLRHFSKVIEKTKQEVNDLEMQLNSVKNEIKGINKTLEEMEFERSKKQLVIDQIRTKHKKTEEILNLMEKYLESKRSVNAKIIKKLKRDTERMKNDLIIDVPRPVAELKALLQDKEAELYSIEDVDDDPDLNVNLENARKNYQTVQTYLEDLKNLIEEMRKLVESHLRPCLVRLNCVSLHVQNRFREILRTRGIQGTLHIDNVLKKLSFDLGERQASGGERTFALVALLVALQDCVDMPFFCMDEFNVYLDGVNYEQAVQLLLEAARMRPGCQYVFITPNEPPGLRSSHDLDIRTMGSLVE